MADQTSNNKSKKYQPSTSSELVDEADAQPQKQSSALSTPGGQQLDFVVRPRFGNRYHIHQPAAPSGQTQPKRESVSLSNVYTKICDPSTQSDALRQLGIQLLSKTRVKLDLQEYPPNFSKHQPNHHPSVDPHSLTESCELRATFTTCNPIVQPMDIRASYIKDAYIEADTAFCCLLETNSPYGDRNSVPVLGRGSFSYLASRSAADKAGFKTAAQQEHCISAASASFLQRAALSMTVLLCLCELSKEDDKMVIDFYRDVDQSFGYGFAPYLDFLVYCCQTSIQHRDSYLKYLCLEWNNKFTQDRMTLALSHFIETRQPTQRYFDEVPLVMSQEELDRDRKLHHSIQGKAAKASMLIKNAGKEHMACCPCHLM